MSEPTKVAVKTEPKSVGPAPRPTHETPFDVLRREIDRVFDSFHTGSWPFPLSRTNLTHFWPRDTWTISPATDVVEKANAYEITAELPGMEEKDIDIKFANHTLTIKGEKKEEKEEKDKDYCVCERRFGLFTRAFDLPDDIDPAKIEAKFGSGVLTVIVPKSAEAKKGEKKIEIKAA